MGHSKMKNKESLYNKTDKKLRKISGTIGAIIVILGALSGILGWIQGQFTSVISEQISELEAKMQVSDRKTEVQITRLELMTLIDTQPENVAEIEKVARYYFNVLKADWYMTGIFSKWCQEYGGDATIIIGAD